MLDFLYSLFTGEYFTILIREGDEWFFFDNKEGAMVFFRTQKRAVNAFFERNLHFDYIEVVMINTKTHEIKLAKASKVPRDDNRILVNLQPASTLPSSAVLA